MADASESRGQTLITWYGRVTTRPRLLRSALLMCAAGLGWIGAFVILPMLATAVLAFLRRGPLGEIVFQFSLENFRRVLGYGLFGWSADNLMILGRSVILASLTTIVCVGLGYPVAFWIAARPARSRYLWLALVVIPLCTNVVIRAYAWMLILSPSLPPARLAQWLGIIPAESALYPSAFAVYLGMVSTSLPFAVLPLYTNVERLDWSLVEASRDLYASPSRVFLHGILPQTFPGLAVAVMLTFVPALGMFVVPDLLGGSKYWLVGNLIQQQFGSSRDWPFGAALSLMLIALTLAGLWVIWRKSRKVELL
jgi:spermidine/putrescine transport system permease protein